ncbi:phage gp6-like head-tail connector protein [Chromobacterium alkanivorans]|uniref:head-tail connector protein n=1 Tax=Chromobacterium alkanivorans TaxID=1071719 RepID=UPI001968A45E|nr:head-tail connector protein [Chromobacterium alkanivorans]MBN3004509.1 phage gp6-like head-tail connector protein [Chromobacterium alkanivorans]
MQEKLITPQAAADIVPLAQIKQQCRVDADITDDDALLTSYTLAAVEACQHKMGRPILPQTWEREFDDPALQLPLRCDVTSVVKVTAVTGSAEIDLAAQSWRLAKGCKLVAMGIWPYGSLLVRVRFACGAWPDAAGVPEPIKLWIMQRVATAYANREALAEDGRLIELPRDFVDGLLDPYRSYR